MTVLDVRDTLDGTSRAPAAHEATRPASSPGAGATTRVFDRLRVHSLGHRSGHFVPAAPPGRPGSSGAPLLVFFRGAGVLQQRGRMTVCAAGSLRFVPGAGPLWFSDVGPGGVVVVELPAEISARAPERMESVVGRELPTDSGAPAFLRSFLDTLDEQLPSYRPECPGWVQSCLCDLVERVLGECAPARPSAAERAVEAAKTYIDCHLADSELDPRGVASEAAVSLRTLNRLFAAEGDSVGSWIRRRRLERCRGDLVDPAKSERGIGQIGAAWGFLDAAHFSRTFKESFGCSPRDYRHHGA